MRWSRCRGCLPIAGIRHGRLPGRRRLRGIGGFVFFSAGFLSIPFCFCYFVVFLSIAFFCFLVDFPENNLVYKIVRGWLRERITYIKLLFGSVLNESKVGHGSETQGSDGDETW